MREGAWSQQLLTWFAAAWFAANIAQGSALADPIRFNRDIRPILAAKCFSCHGPAAKNEKTSLRLASFADATRDLGGRHAILPGDTQQSELIRRIDSPDPDKVMPPSEDRGLTAREKDLLKTWIQQGAAWEGHWAYIPPKTSAPPSVTNAAWILNPIDNFILARLEKEGVAPSPDADRRTLLRRLCFDLRGLPPTVKEVAAFANDTDANAFEKQVTLMISSGQFGERMAMFWLDLVRYADTDGYHADNPRKVWPYRDFVVNAFNQNTPFDTFTMSQLAGDLLPGAGVSEKVASAYNMLVKTTEESGANEKEYLIRYAADRVRTTASAWLGLTLGCAECHDHKYDPVSMRDFYSFAAFFADLKEPGVGPRVPAIIPTPEEAARREALVNEAENVLHQMKNAQTAALPGLEAGVSRLHEEFRANRLGWKPAHITHMESKIGRTFQPHSDGSVVVKGDEAQDEYKFELAPSIESVASLRIQAFRDPESVREIERQGFSYQYSISELVIEVLEPGQPPRRVQLVTAFADIDAKGHPATAAIDGNSKTFWIVGERMKAETTHIGFLFAQPVPIGPETRLRIQIVNGADGFKENLRHIRIDVSREADAAFFPFEQGLSSDVSETLARPRSAWTEADQSVMKGFYLWQQPEVRRLDNILRGLEDTRKKLDEEMTACLISETNAPRETRILARGNWMDESGPVVEPTVPAIFSHDRSPTNRLSRLDLAKWLVARDNPLTARVFVNRLWKLFFGTGLVTTLNDFGMMGDSPLHPELLDQLAEEFMASGWNVKHLVNLIVTSHTYRQSSTGRPDLEARDPQNRLFARQGRWRLDAEMIRDNALYSAGILVTNIGGDSVFPYQPEGHLDNLDFPQRNYSTSTNLLQFRRGLYTFWQRTFLHPAMALFDAPAREECVGERPVSNTPLQALALLNNETHVEAARFFAASALTASLPNDEMRIKRIFESAVGRFPDEQETAILLRLQQQQRQRLSGRDSDAKALRRVGTIHLPTDASDADVAAWTAVTRAVLNLHETNTRY